MGREGEKCRVLLLEFSSVLTEQLSSARGWPRSRVSSLVQIRSPMEVLTLYMLFVLFFTMCVFVIMCIYTHVRTFHWRF